MKINMNDEVKVKLKPKGISILKSRYEEIKKEFPSFGGFRLPETDEDGYTKFQLWDLMHIFGNYIELGFDVPFETEIII